MKENTNLKYHTKRRNPQKEMRKGAGKIMLAFLLMLISLFCLIFLTNKGQIEFPISGAITSTALYPLQSGFSKFKQKTIESVRFFANITEVYEENKNLKREIEKLRSENLEASEHQAENERLKKLLNYKKSKKEFNLISARVIGKENAAWTSVIVIDKGKNDGIENLMPVITPKGLVGHITEANFVSSKAELILDPRSSVSALVERSSSRITGMVEGDLDNFRNPKMVNLSVSADIVAGDMIITSGFGGVYPKGIMIGSVKELKNAPGGLLKYATIDTSVDFETLEEVFVIANSNQER